MHTVQLNECELWASCAFSCFQMFSFSNFHHPPSGYSRLWRFCMAFEKRRKNISCSSIGTDFISISFLQASVTKLNGSLRWHVSACASVCGQIDPIEIEMKKVRKSNYVFWKVERDWMVFILLMFCDRSNERYLVLVRNAQTSCQPKKIGEKKRTSLYN